MLYYLPLEPYPERYTQMMSCKDGWAETCFKKNNVPFVRIDGKQLNKTITHGVVLDACGRCFYAESQISQVIELINSGILTSSDTIYAEDFWHPAIESLFYIRQLLHLNFKIGCFLHAQSVDDTDFSYKMRNWLRPLEIGFGKGYDYIFVCSEILRQLCIQNEIGSKEKIHTIGLPYNSERLLQQLKEMGFKYQPKENYVLFSSRFDEEKDPNFFLDLVESCPDIQFKIVNPRKNVPISNSRQVVARLEKVLHSVSNLEVVDTTNKIDYYSTLQKAKVQFNCANQDWVSWTLLEAVTFDCLPLYPFFKDFPLELNYNEKYLYKKNNLNDCKEKLYALMNSKLVNENKFIVKKHDSSWEKYLRIMNLI